MLIGDGTLVPTRDRSVAASSGFVVDHQQGRITAARMGQISRAELTARVEPPL
ncbi:hypothetical protein ACFY8K_37625 [Streptomyces misionensis]|uniref:hypothetical protein n=1 Tax=Streptomyces misionensis TaxID=67331 RepID=UPI0036795CFF